MWKLIKETFLSSLKNKMIFFGLTSLVLIVSTVFVSLNSVKSNLTKKVKEYDVYSKTPDISVDLDFRDQNLNVSLNDAFLEEVETFEPQNPKVDIYLNSKSNYIPVSSFEEFDSKEIANFYFKTEDIYNEFLRFKQENDPFLIFDIDNNYFFLKNDSELELYLYQKNASGFSFAKKASFFVEKNSLINLIDKNASLENFLNLEKENGKWYLKSVKDFYLNLESKEISSDFLVYKNWIFEDKAYKISKELAAKIFGFSYEDDRYYFDSLKKAWWKFQLNNQNFSKSILDSSFIYKGTEIKIDQNWKINLEKGKKYFYSLDYLEPVKVKTYYRKHNYTLSLNTQNLSVSEDKKKFLDPKNQIWNEFYVSYFLDQINRNKKIPFYLEPFFYWEKVILPVDDKNYWFNFFAKLNPQDFKTNLINEKSKNIVGSIFSLEKIDSNEDFDAILNYYANSKIAEKKLSFLKTQVAEIAKNEITNKIINLYQDEKNNENYDGLIDYNNIGIRETTTITALENGENKIYHFINTGGANSEIDGIKNNVGKFLEQSKKTYNGKIINQNFSANLDFVKNFNPENSTKIIPIIFKNFTPDPNLLKVNVVFEKFIDYYSENKIPYLTSDAKIIVLKQEKINNSDNYRFFDSNSNLGVTSLFPNKFILLRKENGLWVNYLKKTFTFAELEKFFKDNPLLTIDVIVGKDGWLKERKNFPGQFYLPFYYKSVPRQYLEEIKSTNSIKKVIENIKEVILNSDLINYIGDPLDVEIILKTIEISIYQNDFQKILSIGKINQEILKKTMINLINNLSNPIFIDSLKIKPPGSEGENYINKIFINLINNFRKNLNQVSVEKRNEYFNKNIKNLFFLLGNRFNFFPKIISNIFQVFLLDTSLDPNKFLDFVISFINAIDFKKFTDQALYWYDEKTTDPEVQNVISDDQILFFMLNSIDLKKFKLILVNFLNKINLSGLFNLNSNFYSSFLKNNSLSKKEKILFFIKKVSRNYPNNLKDFLIKLVSVWNLEIFKNNLEKSFVEKVNKKINNQQVYTYEKEKKLKIGALQAAILDSFLNSGVNNSSSQFSNVFVESLNVSQKVQKNILLSILSLELPAKDYQKITIFDLQDFLNVLSSLTFENDYDLDTIKKITDFDKDKTKISFQNLGFYIEKLKKKEMDDLFSIGDLSFIKNNLLINEDQIDDSHFLVSKLEFLKKVFDYFKLNKFQSKDQITGFNFYDEAKNIANLSEKNLKEKIAREQLTFTDYAWMSANFYDTTSVDKLLKNQIYSVIFNNDKASFNNDIFFRYGLEYFDFWIQLAYQISQENPELTLLEIKDILEKIILIITDPYSEFYQYFSEEKIPEKNDLFANFLNYKFTNVNKNSFNFFYNFDHKINSIYQLNKSLEKIIKKNLVSSYKNFARIVYSQRKYKTNLKEKNDLIEGVYYHKVIYKFVSSFLDPKINFIKTFEDLKSLAKISSDSTLKNRKIESFGISDLVLNPILNLTFPILFLDFVLKNNLQDSIFSGNLAHLLDKIFSLNISLSFEEKMQIFSESFTTISYPFSVSKPKNQNENIKFDLLFFENFYKNLEDEEGNDISFFGFNIKKFFKQMFEKILVDISENNQLIFNSPYSYLAIVNPAFLAQNKKEVYQGEVFNDYLKMQKLIFELDQKNKINVNGVDFIIVGTDTTADYLYPSVSENFLQANPQTQALVYVNNEGFEKIKKEGENKKYLNIKAKSLNHKGKIEEVKKINKIFAENALNSNAKKAYLTSEIDFINPERYLRISTIPLLIEKISKFNFFLIGLISFLVMLANVFIIKRFVSLKTKVLGILNSQGYKKREIVISFLPISFFIALVASFLGFIIGNFLENSVLNIFKTYWTNPINKFNFVFSDFLISFVTSFAFLSLIISLTVLWILKTKPMELITGNFDQTISNIFSKVSRKLHKRPLQTRFIFSLILSSIFKILSLSFSVFISTFIILFSLSSNGVFEKAIEQTYKNKKYEYKIEFITPTNEGGPIIPFSGFDIEKNLYVPSLDLYKKDGKVLNFIGFDFKNPGFFDPKGAFILKEKPIDAKSSFPVVASKNSLDINFDFSVEFNSFDVVFASLPDSQKSRIVTILEKSAIELEKTQYVLNSEGKFSEPQKGISYFKYIKPISQSRDFKSRIGNFIYKRWDPNLKIYKEERISNVNYQKYRDFLVQGYQKINDIDFFLSFSGILFNSKSEKNNSSDFDSETFTYADFVYKENKYQILGYKPNRKFVEYQKILKQTETEEIQNEEFPVFVNLIFATKNNLKKGDVFEIEISNESDRFLQKIQNIPKKKTKLKVLGVLNSYIGDEIITSQKIVNKILGLEVLKINPNWKIGFDGEPFNGILTNQKSPEQIFANAAIYSESGYWAFEQKNNFNAYSQKNKLEIFDYLFDEKSNFMLAAKKYPDFLQNILQQIKNKFPDFDVSQVKSFSGLKKYPDKIDFVLNLYQLTYGSNNYIPAFKSIESKQVRTAFVNDIYSFVNQTNTILSFIFVLISIIILIIFASLIISENRKSIAIMSMLGFNKKEKLKIFFLFYVPVVLFIVLISIPFVFLFVYFLQIQLIFTLGISFPYVLTFYSVAITMLMQMVIFVVSLISSWINLEKVKAIEVVKDN